MQMLQTITPSSSTTISSLATSSPTVTALNAVVYAQTKLLFEKNSHETLEMASLTKIMTFFCSLKLCQKYSLDTHSTYIYIPRFASNMCGTIAGLRAGEHIKLFDLFYALMLPSGNDAACVLASFFGSLEASQKKKSPPPIVTLLPSIFDSTKTLSIYTTPHSDQTNCAHMKYFVRCMNAEAMKIQMRSTQFSNPHGLSDKANKSSAVDLARLCYTAMAVFPVFRNVVKTIRHAAVTLQMSMNGIATLKKARDVTWTNTNKLLQTDPRFIGIKTGSTPNAGYCLATHFSKGDVHLYIVVLKCRDSEKRWADSVKLAEWAFNYLESEKQASQIPFENVKQLRAQHAGRSKSALIWARPSQQIQSQILQPLILQQQQQQLQHQQQQLSSQFPLPTLPTQPSVQSQQSSIFPRPRPKSILSSNDLEAEELIIESNVQDDLDEPDLEITAPSSEVLSDGTTVTTAVVVAVQPEKYKQLRHYSETIDMKHNNYNGINNNYNNTNSSQTLPTSSLLVRRSANIATTLNPQRQSRGSSDAVLASSYSTRVNIGLLGLKSSTQPLVANGGAAIRMKLMSPTRQLIDSKQSINCNQLFIKQKTLITNNGSAIESNTGCSSSSNNTSSMKVRSEINTIGADLANADKSEQKSRQNVFVSSLPLKKQRPKTSIFLNLRPQPLQLKAPAAMLDALDKKSSVVDLLQQPSRVALRSQQQNEKPLLPSIQQALIGMSTQAVVAGVTG